MVTKAPSKNGKPKNGKPRIQLAEAFAKAQPGRLVRASYDAAGSGSEYANIWTNTDSFSADAANSRAVRERLVQRSRFENNSNGFAAGINSRWADDCIGTGPTLRMQTSSENFNRMVEREFKEWAKEIHLRRKLWTLAHAFGQDGEGMGAMRLNRGLRHSVKLDLVLFETEQCQTPSLGFGEENKIDGIKFDQYGNPVYYDILNNHPGDELSIPFSLTPERVPARFIAHWYKIRRPGQHRGIPENTSTLNVGAAGRRFREAVVAAAENVADYSLLLKTTLDPDTIDAVDPMSTIDIQKRMMVALPAGYEVTQPDAGQPAATYETFVDSIIGEMARPRQMPFIMAKGDASNANFASGKLDHIGYYNTLTIDRADCNDMVLDVPVFNTWFDLAVVAFGWLGGDPTKISDAAKAHVWDWPKHQVADIKSEAAANQTRLMTGQTSLPELYSDAGKDYQDKTISLAAATGITPEQVKQLDILRNMPAHAINQAAAVLGIATPSAEPNEPADEPEEDDDDE